MAGRPQRRCTLGLPGAFFPALPSSCSLGTPRAWGVSSFQQQQTTRTQPSHSLLHQHKDASSLLDTEMPCLPQRGGLSPALRLSQATRQSLPVCNAQKPRPVSQSCPGSTGGAGKEGCLPRDSLQAEGSLQDMPTRFCSQQQVRDGDQALRAPFAWRHGTHPSVPHLLEGLTPFPSGRKLWIF